jgi:hypothetical protein
VGPNGDVHDIAGMLNIVVDYYKFLFGSENRLDINLADDFWAPNEKVSNMHNSALDVEYTEKEIKEAVFGSLPDGFPFMFYQEL